MSRPHVSASSQDTDELWRLSMCPSRPHALTESERGDGHAADAGGVAVPFESAEFKARQARTASVLHATPAAAGHSTMHSRVFGAARAEARRARETTTSLAGWSLVADW